MPHGGEYHEAVHPRTNDILDRERVGVARFLRAWEAENHWVWNDVLVPFGLTRLVLLIAGWFSQYFPRSLTYEAGAVARGWQFSSHRLLDIWGRWDTGWYFNIVSAGYRLNGDVQTVESNIAFFPLYPYLVKLLVQLIPEQLRTTGAVLFVGIVLSNLFLLGALILLYRLVISLLQDAAVARRTILYLLVFPASFFLSSFYTESLFLFLSVAVFYAASKQAWGLAGVLGGLLALTRLPGVLIVVPLTWMYLESRGWQWRRIRLNLAWFALVPIGLLVFLFSLQPLTGNLLAPLQNQAAWDRSLATPWYTWTHSLYYNPYTTPVEQVFTLVFLSLGLASLVVLHSRAYTIYALLLLVPPLFTGTLLSVMRFYAVMFPLFIVLAVLCRRPNLDRFVTMIFLTVQVLFMVAWSQFYWIA